MKAQLNTVLANLLANHDFKVVTNVPGFGGTQVYDEFKKMMPQAASICFNEEAAFSISTGASIYGKRAAALVKTHGLTKMSNALCSTLSVGNNAANLIIAFDDTTGKSSDNIFDAKKFIEGTEAPYVILGDDPEKDIVKAIKLSEQLQLSVIVYVDCEKLGLEFPISNHMTQYSGDCFIKNPVRFVACPPLSQFHREVFLKKKSQGFGIGEYNAPQIIQNIPNALPPHLKKIFETYTPIFDAFGKVNANFTAGDAGTASLYAFHRKKYIDACTYMGGAPGMALGAHMAGAQKAWAFTGDFSFLAAGILGLNEIVSRDAPVKIIIFNNGVAGATGGQTLPKGVMDNFIRGHSHLIEFLDVKMPQETLIRMMEKINESETPKIGIVNIN